MQGVFYGYRCPSCGNGAKMLVGCQTNAQGEPLCKKCGVAMKVDPSLAGVATNVSCPRCGDAATLRIGKPGKCGQCGGPLRPIT